MTIKVKITIVIGDEHYYTTIDRVPDKRVALMRSVKLPPGITEIELEIVSEGLSRPDQIYRELAYYLQHGRSSHAPLKDVSDINGYYQDILLTATRLQYQEMFDEYLTEYLPKLERMTSFQLIQVLRLNKLSSFQTAELLERYR